MSDTGWQTTPRPVDPDIAASVEHVQALLPKDAKTSWGRLADRLDGATRDELMLMARSVI